MQRALIFLFLGFCSTVSANDHTTEPAQLYADHCAACHDSVAGAHSLGPDLRDGNWKYGGTLEQIERSISQGRRSLMPALGVALGDTGLDQVVDHVRYLGGLTETGDAEGANLFMIFCASCHSEGGEGTPGMGAPDLTDGVWLYGSSAAAVSEVIAEGRTSEMPAFAAVIDAAGITSLARFLLQSTDEDRVSTR